MTPAEHLAEAERELATASDYRVETDFYRAHIATAQVHATLALTPAPPPPAQAPQQRRWDLTGTHEFQDAQLYRLEVWPTEDRTAVLVGDDKSPWLFEDPTTLRALASLLTAHADRLEPKL